MTDWLTVEGALLSETERRWLKRAAEQVAEVFQDPLLLNIGIYKGASMHCLRAGAPKALLVGIDVSIKKIIDAESLAAELIQGNSRKVGPKWNRPIHLLFIDGGHQYATVREDILNFGQYVVVGGIMSFHDYARSEEYLRVRAENYLSRPPLGVRKAVFELLVNNPWWKPLRVADSIGAFRRVK